MNICIFPISVSVAVMAKTVYIVGSFGRGIKVVEQKVLDLPGDRNCLISADISGMFSVQMP